MEETHTFVPVYSPPLEMLVQLSALQTQFPSSLQKERTLTLYSYTCHTLKSPPHPPQTNPKARHSSLAKYESNSPTRYHTVPYRTVLLCIC